MRDTKEPESFIKMVHVPDFFELNKLSVANAVSTHLRFDLKKIASSEQLPVAT